MQPKATRLRDRAADAAFTARQLAKAGLIRRERPDRLLRAAVALRRFGPTPAAGYTAAAARAPDRTAIEDERGAVTFGELHRRTNALARALSAAGVGPGDGVALLARNHRGFVETTVACSKLGADAVYLNTGLAAPQIAAVIDRERPTVLIHDAEFTDVCTAAARARPTFLAWGEGPKSGPPGLDDLIAGGA